MAPVNAQLLGGHPRGLFLGGGVAIVAGVIFTMLGLDMGGVARVGIVGIGVMAVLVGIRQVVLGTRLRGIAGRKGPES
jgi:hypothetical protein